MKESGRGLGELDTMRKLVGKGPNFGRPCGIYGIFVEELAAARNFIRCRNGSISVSDSSASADTHAACNDNTEENKFFQFHRVWLLPTSGTVYVLVTPS